MVLAMNQLESSIMSINDIDSTSVKTTKKYEKVYSAQRKHT